MGNCDACPVPEGLACYRIEGMCRRAAESGEGAFRARLVEHAKIRARQAEMTEADRARIRRASKPRVPLGKKPDAG